MSSPQHYRADDTLQCVGDELGGANIVEVQNHPNFGVDGKAKTGMKGGLIEGHLAWASRLNGFTRLRKPNLNT